jgi:hypothetical protein
VPRPWRAPDVLLAAGCVLSYFNALLLGAGANVYGKATLATGLVVAALIVPVFAWRHYFVDRGRFPAAMLADLQIADLATAPRRAGWKPYVALAGGVLAMAAGQLAFG